MVPFPMSAFFSYFFLGTASSPISNQPFEHVHFQAKADSFTLDAPAIIDSGSTSTVVPKSYLDKRCLKSLYTRPGGTVQGIGGKAKVCGYFVAQIRMGSLVVPNVECMVVDAVQGGAPLLIGQNVMKHPSLKLYTVNHSEKSISFEFKSHNAKQTVPYSDARCSDPCVTHTAAHSYSTSFSYSLQSKLSELKDCYDIDLKHENTAELEKFADLVLDFRHLMGSDDNMGLLKGAEAKLETEGEPVNIPPRRIHAQKNGPG